jgi:hypothetical protein
MARNVSEIIKKLSPARRGLVKARAVALIAEEMKLRGSGNRRRSRVTSS